MKLPQFFIDRPIFAVVISIIIMLVGGLAYFKLPVSQYPEVALPTVVVRANYPGATPETIARTVATPLEQEINGVENMEYMESSSTADGSMQLTISFKLGTDLDAAQVLVQNRVAVAQPRLPEEVRRIGITTTKSSPDLMMVVHMISPDDSRDQLYIGNYVNLNVRDVIARIEGVGDALVFGGRLYSMRVWLDVDRLAAYGLTAPDVVASLREQNIQVAAGVIGQPPVAAGSAFQISIATEGRLESEDQFAAIVVKTGADGRLVRLADVARIELGAQDYNVNSFLDGQNAVAIVIFQRPGTNALETAGQIRATMDELRKNFPPGVDYRIVYNPTRWVEESIDEVFHTLILAALFVVFSVFLFLQDWRTTLVPVAAIPVSLIGTFAVMLGLGFSLNNLSLFGLVLAIGIVVDDAIVVVENVQRLIQDGMRPKAATRQAMKEVAGALIATTVVLVAVFVPTSFIQGISGAFYREFAVTISVATMISTVVSLTLSPALCATLLRPKGAPMNPIERLYFKVFGWFFVLFNRLFDWGSRGYAGAVRRVLRVSFLAVIAYLGLCFATWKVLDLVPTGFVPEQDQGYLIVAAQLPEGASLERTTKVVQQVKEIALGTPGIKHAVGFAGFSGATRTNAPNAAAIFTGLDDAARRSKEGLGAEVIINDLRRRLAVIDDAFVFVISPPPVRGVGTGGGFKMQVQDRGGHGVKELEQVTQQIVYRAWQEKGLSQVYSTFRVNTPEIYADIDRVKARMLDVPLDAVFATLQTYLGSVYVNDFNYLGRTYRVVAQADAGFRDEERDIPRLRTRSTTGASVPLGSLLTVKHRTGPDRVVRYNLYPAADISGSTAPGFSSSQSLATMERIAAEVLPAGYGYEWTDLAYQEKKVGNAALFVFGLSVIFAFLALAAQYESWLLPLAIILIVPLVILFALGGIWFRGMSNDILTQIGFVLLIGLACKNAILIVEFAKQEEDAGRDRFAAAVEACRLRLRPILMTALSFVLGVLPLLFARGAGAEMRKVLGTAVFTGMVGVTILGLYLTPVFYVLLRGLVAKREARRKAEAIAAGD
ncbi:MAG: efflux RND transporter permease subunit [Planctomycetes bacterium]|nr:efflux RND transporter permease subunit [Planctomycetota bacterium]